MIYKNDTSKNKAFIYSIIVFCLISIFCFNALGCSTLTYKKNREGKTVLMERDSIFKYDKNGNTILHKSKYMHETYKYDSNGNMILRKNKGKNPSDSYEIDYIYDNNLLIEEVYNGESIVKNEYNEKGLITHRKDQSGDMWNEYNQNGNLTKITYSSGETVTCEYDDNGNIISRESETGYKVLYEYNENNLLVKTYFPDSIETRDYDSQKRLILNRTDYEDSSYSLITFEYLEDGNTITTSEYYNPQNSEISEDAVITVVIYEEDKNGNMLKYNFNNESVTEYYYDFDKGGRVLRSYIYKQDN